MEWGSCVSAKRRNYLARLMDFMVEAKAFAGQHEKFRREIVSDLTLQFIYDLLPNSIL